MASLDAPPAVSPHTSRNAAGAAPDAAAVSEHARAAIEKGSTSFSAASKLFSRRMREDVWALYAWCRRCDDIIDGQDHGGALAQLSEGERRARLDRLRRMTDAALKGEPVEDPAFAALQTVAMRHGLDERWPKELLAGFAMDVDGRRYESLRDVLEYCWGVAGVVGVMMAKIMGADGAETLRRAQDLGLAFQLTNICRDIVEDARAGRVYLPAEALKARGAALDAEDLAEQSRGPAYEAALELLALAERYYASSRQGLRALPLRAAIAVAAARDVYRGIGRRIARSGPSALQRRMRVPRPMLAVLLVRGAGVALWSRFEKLSAPLERPPLWSRI